MTTSKRVNILLAFCLALAVVILPSAGADQEARAQSADGSGVAAFAPPASLQAGLTGTLDLVFTATDTIATRGAIRVEDPDFHERFFRLSGGDLSVTSNNPSVTLTVQRRGYRPSFAHIQVSSGELRAGDVVTLTYENLDTPVKAYQAVECETLTDADGNGTFAPISVQPRFDILPDPTPDLMVATGPTYVQIGVPFALTVRVLDKYGNPSVDFADTLTFTSTDALAVLPPDPSPFPPGSGVCEFSVTLNTIGFQYVYVEGAGALQTNSSPFVVVDSLAAQPQLFWGDLHGHFGHVYISTMGQRVDEYMEYARDVSDLDFACETPKADEYQPNFEEVQAEVEASVFQYDDPGRFVTIRGWEWTRKPSDEGHHNVYFSGPTGPVYSCDDPASDTLDELWALLEANTPPGEEAVTPPHALSFTCPNCWQLCDDREFNRRYRPLAEVFSLWGSSETSGNGSARRALAYGHRIGFYGSSDTHWALPGNPQPEAWLWYDVAGGLAAVRADALTRDALWEGLMQRHVYATEGERIFLEFTVDGYPMGSEITAATAPRIVVTAAGTATLSEVEVIKGSYVEGCTRPLSIDSYYAVIHSATPGELTTSFEVSDESFDASAFYYVRVTQADGKRAWSSPIWVDYSTTPNNPPVADAGGPYSGTEDVAIVFDGSGSSDPDGDELSYSWDFGGGTTGTGVSPSHAYEYGGTFTVIVTVSDGRGGLDTDSTTAAVDEVNDPPVADPNGPYSGTVGEPITFDGSASLDPDNQDGTTANDQTLSYAWDFGDESTGTGVSPSHTYVAGAEYTVTLVVSDGITESAPVTTTASVTAPNNTPVANDATASGDEDTSIPWTPSVSDLDGDPLTCSIVGQPSNGSASVNSDCSSGTYTPDPNFNGDDTFSYKANDGTDDSDPATVFVTVNPVNDPPVADGQSVTTPEDTPVDITLTGSDPDGDPLTYSVVTGPSYGSLSGTEPNLTYTPNPGFTGEDSFTFKVNDGTVDSAPATVSITVTPPGPPNQIQNGGFETDLSFWVLSTYGTAEAVLSRDESTAGEGMASARVDVTAPGLWLRHIQFTQGGLSLVEGDSYTLAFWARASVARAIRILLRPSGITWAYYNDLRQEITTTWQTYEFTFTAGGTDANATLEFTLGQYASTVWLDGIELSATGP